MDECAGPVVAERLRMLEHDVISIHPDYRGMDDRDILRWANADNRILVTSDKDFGELVFREGEPHKGVILLRMSDQTPVNKIEILRLLTFWLSPLLEGSFTVVTDSKIRITLGLESEP